MASPAPTWPEPTRWALERLARGGGTVLLLGGVDTGKSTLAAELVNRGLAAGRRVAVVDADVGQSDVGPPATIGLGFPGAPAGSLAEIAAERLYFVGDTSPAGHLLPAVVGTSRLAHVARARGCDLIVVDTTGMVSGRLAEALKFHKIQAVRPRALVAVQAAAEVEPLLAPFDAPGGPRIVRLGVAPGARRKSTDERRERRRRAMARYLAGAREVVLDRAAVRLWPPTGPAGLARLRGRVCGILDARGDTLAVGILEAADPYALALFAPLPDADAVAIVQPGSISITRQGEEIGG